MSAVTPTKAAPSSPTRRSGAAAASLGTPIPFSSPFTPHRFSPHGPSLYRHPTTFISPPAYPINTSSSSSSPSSLLSPSASPSALLHRSTGSLDDRFSPFPPRQPNLADDSDSDSDERSARDRGGDDAAAAAAAGNGDGGGGADVLSVALAKIKDAELALSMADAAHYTAIIDRLTAQLNTNRVHMKAWEEKEAQWTLLTAQREGEQRRTVQLETEVAALRADLQQQQQQQQQQHQQQRGAKEEGREALTATVRRLQEALKEKEEEAERLDREVEDARGEHIRLLERLADVEEQITVQTATEEAREQDRAKERAALLQTVEQLRAAEAQTRESAERRVQEERERYEQLVGTVKGVEDEMAGWVREKERVERDITDLRQQNERLQRSADQAKAQLQAAEQRWTQQQSDSRAAAASVHREESTALREQFDAAQQQLQTLRKERDSDRAEFEQREQRWLLTKQQWEAALQQLQQQHASEDSQRATALSSAQREAADVRAQLEDAIGERSRLSRRLEEERREWKDSAERKERWQEEENAAMKEELSVMQAEIEKMEAWQRAQVEREEQQHRDIEEQRSRMEDEVGSMRSQMEAVVQDLAKKNREHREHIAAHTQLIADKDAQLAQARATIDHTNALLQAERATVEELRAQCAGHADVIDALKGQKGGEERERERRVLELEKALMANRGLERELAATKKKLIELRGDVERVEHERDERVAKDDFDSAITAMRQLEQDRKDKEREVEGFQHAADDSRQRLSELERSGEQWQIDRQQLLATVRRHEEQLHRLAALEAEKAALAEELHTGREQDRRLKEQLQMSETRFVERDFELSQLKEHAERRGREVERLTADLRSAKDAAQHVHQLQERLQAAEEEAAAARKLVDEERAKARAEREERERVKAKAAQHEELMKAQHETLLRELRALTEWKESTQRAEDVEQQEEEHKEPSPIERRQRVASLAARAHTERLLAEDDSSSEAGETRAQRYERAKKTLKQAYDTLIYAENNVSVLLAQREKANAQIAGLHAQLHERQQQIAQLQADAARARSHEGAEVLTSLLSKYEAVLTQAQHYKDRAKHFKQHAQHLHDRLKAAEAAAPAAGRVAMKANEDDHSEVRQLRREAREWRMRASAAEERLKQREADGAQTRTLLHVVELLRQRLRHLHTECELLRDEVPVLINEAVLRATSDVQRVVTVLRRENEQQRADKQRLQENLVTVRQKLGSRYESLLLAHHRHHRQYSDLLHEQEQMSALPRTTRRSSAQPRSNRTDNVILSPSPLCGAD